jgi:hypothetical protein
MQDANAVLGAEMERVSPKIPVLFDRDGLFYATLEKIKGEVVSSRDMRQPLEISPGGAFRQFDTDDGDMGVGDGPKYDKALVNTVPLLHAIQWTLKAEWGTDDARKAVVNTFRNLLAKSMAEFRRNVDSLCVRGEGNGIMATISTVATAGGVDTYTLAAVGDGFGAKLIRKGNYYNIFSADLLTNRTAAGAVQCTYVDLANKIVKFAAVAGAIATDYIVIDGATSTPPVSIKGIQYNHSSASTGNWFGFDRSITPEIRANSVNAAAALTQPLPRLAINKIGDRIGIEQRQGSKLSAWMHPAQQSQYEALGYNAIQIIKEAKDEPLDLYFNDNMRMAGAPVKLSYSWDKTRIDFVDPSVWGRAEMHAPGFHTVDGRKIFPMRGASGGLKASQIFYLVCQFNPYVNNPAACSYIYALTVPSGY